MDKIEVKMIHRKHREIPQFYSFWGGFCPKTEIVFIETEPLDPKKDKLNLFITEGNHNFSRIPEPCKEHLALII